MHLEVDTEDRDSPREPTEVVVTRSELAGGCVLRLDRPPVRGDMAGEMLGRGVKRDSGLVARRRPGDALLDIRDRIASREDARREPEAARRRTREPIDAEGAPVLAAAVPGDEVPAATEVHEGVRLDLAAAVGALTASVGEAEALGVAAGGRDRRQMLRIDGRATGRWRQGRRAKSLDTT